MNRYCLILKGNIYLYSKIKKIMRKDNKIKLLTYTKILLIDDDSIVNELEFSRKLDLTEKIIKKEKKLTIVALRITQLWDAPQILHTKEIDEEFEYSYFKYIYTSNQFNVINIIPIIIHLFRMIQEIYNDFYCHPYLVSINIVTAITCNSKIISHEDFLYKSLDKFWGNLTTNDITVDKLANLIIPPVLEMTEYYQIESFNQIDIIIHGNGKN